MGGKHNEGNIIIMVTDLSVIKCPLNENDVERKKLIVEHVQTLIKTSDLINLQPVRCSRTDGGTADS